MKRTSLTDGFILLFTFGVILMSGLGCGLSERLGSLTNTPGNGASNGVANGRSTTPKPPGETKADDKLFESQTQLREFLAALTAAVGGDNPNLLDLSFYDSYAMVQVQDSNKPENVDGYTWRNGELSPPSPVKIIGGGKIEDNVFPLKDVNIDGLPDLTKEMMEKLKDVEGGSMVGYKIKRNLPFSKEILIRPLTNSTRKTVYSEADKDAKLKKFEIK